jgi:hypothetical protein
MTPGGLRVSQVEDDVVRHPTFLTTMAAPELEEVVA